MRSNGRIIGPLNRSLSGIWNVDDQGRGGVILPVTEALADAKTAVWEMTGGTSANEVGAGGGLTGDDQVLTQVGGAPAAANGGRAVSSAIGFTATAAALTVLLGGPEWTLMLLLNTWQVEASDNRYISYLSASAAVNGEIYTSRRTPNTAGTMVAGISNGIFTGITPHRSVPPTTGDVWAAMWRKAGICHSGWLAGSLPPTSWDSFPANQRQLLIGGGDLSGCNWGTYRYVVGLPGYSGSFIIKRVVLSKIGLAAADM
jgi:hypothetical protein